MKRVRRVWDDLASNPQEADDLAARAELMIALRVFLEGADLIEVEARYGVARKVVADILAGRIDKLSLGTLQDLRDTISTAGGP